MDVLDLLLDAIEKLQLDAGGEQRAGLTEQARRMESARRRGARHLRDRLLAQREQYARRA